MIQTRSFLLALAVSGLLAAEQNGWHFHKDDLRTKKHVLTVDAERLETARDHDVFVLHGMTARIYGADGETFKEVKSENALFDGKAGTLRFGPNLSEVLRLK